MDVVTRMATVMHNQTKIIAVLPEKNVIPAPRRAMFVMEMENA
jgi:hypothetical protein